ncbi:MAG TPA: ABC transporter permease, partial [Gemmatimonadales bacterium]|nr:ABC transporter permease [Gemmatimonadales bacterium]
RRLLGRIGQAALTWALAVTLAFFLMRLTPGSPIAALDEETRMAPDQVERLRRLYCLDCPLLTQYTTFLSGAVSGNLGGSIRYNGQPVNALIASRLPATLLLGGTVLLINFTLGSWLGALQAVRQGSRLDHGLSFLSLTLYAIPSFWLGLTLAWLFGIEWHLLPVAGIHDVTLSAEAGALTRGVDLLRHLILPALTLSAVSIAATMRHQRSAMLEALRLDCVRTARAKGLTERQVLLHHAWRNAVGPMITLFGLWLPILVTGAVFVEAVFGWPGLGSLASEAINNRDYPLIMGATLLAAGLVVLGGLVADLLHGWFDPRVEAI